jgi:hypothetical protein
VFEQRENIGSVEFSFAEENVQTESNKTEVFD